MSDDDKRLSIFPPADIVRDWMQKHGYLDGLTDEQAAAEVRATRDRIAGKVNEIMSAEAKTSAIDIARGERRIAVLRVTMTDLMAALRAVGLWRFPADAVAVAVEQDRAAEWRGEARVLLVSSAFERNPEGRNAIEIGRSDR